MHTNNFTILVAEDNEDGAFLLRTAFTKAGITNPVKLVQDGAEAIAYLAGSGKFADRQEYPFPGCLMLDLKMPGTDGFEVLQWLRNHPNCSVIPAVVLSSSAQESDVRRAYQLGANCYITKPTSFEKTVALVRAVCDFWKLCERPPVSEC